MSKIAAAVVAALLALTACGGGEQQEPPQQQQQAQENLQAALLEQDAALTGRQLEEDQADCIAQGMVDEVGVAQLQEYGLLDEELAVSQDPAASSMEQGDAEALAAVFVECADLEATLEEELASADGAEQLTDDQRACIQEAINADRVEAALAAMFQGEAVAPAAEMQADLQSCLGGAGVGEMEMPGEG